MPYVSGPANFDGKSPTICVMSTQDCVIGLDISTTASKALVIGTNGRTLGLASSPHAISSPFPLWSEQDPSDWWQAAQESLRRVLADNHIDPACVRALGLTGQMHGLVLVDENGSPLRPAMLWNDGRSSVQCDAIRRSVGLDRLIAATGNDAFTGFTAPKLLWVREHEPEVYRNARCVLLPKDYVRFKLTGTYATDKAGAGGTLLLDLASRDWSDHMLQALDIPRAWLPPSNEGPSVTGYVSSAGARATGLREGIPVVAGAGDQAAQATGVGAVRPDIWALTLGTSGVVFAPCDAPRTDAAGRAHAFPHAAPGLWHMMGVMLSAAGSLEWYRRTLAPKVKYNDLLKEAASAPPGCNGLMFLPYLTGERTPHADPLAQGAFVGLTPRHGRAHMTRAILEGVAFGLRDNLDLLVEAGLSAPTQIRLSGGGAKSTFWRQILADVLQLNLHVVEVTEGAALGAALLAGTGAGFWSSVELACDAVVTTHASSGLGPDSEHYGVQHQRFKDLYLRLKPFFAESH